MARPPRIDAGETPAYPGAPCVYFRTPGGRAKRMNDVRRTGQWRPVVETGDRCPGERRVLPAPVIPAQAGIQVSRERRSWERSCLARIERLRTRFGPHAGGTPAFPGRPHPWDAPFPGRAWASMLGRETVSVKRPYAPCARVGVATRLSTLARVALRPVRAGGRLNRRVNPPAFRPTPRARGWAWDDDLLQAGGIPYAPCARVGADFLGTRASRPHRRPPPPSARGQDPSVSQSSGSPARKAAGAPHRSPNTCSASRRRSRGRTCRARHSSGAASGVAA